MNSRYQELDSLRGIAAMSVVLFHMAMVLPDSWKETALWNLIFVSPLHFLLTGEQPVILFFVLSGFVLSLIFFSGKKVLYFPFIVKRVIRLYLPYAVAISFAILLCLSFAKGGNSELGYLFNLLWVEKVNPKIIIDHLFFIGNYNVYTFNIVIWTLIHEMRISLLIPLLALLIIRFSWKMNLTIGLGLGILGAGLHFFLQDPYQPFYKTLLYILMFIVGMLLSKNRDYLTRRFKAFSKRSKWLLALTGILLYIYADILGNPLLVDWVTTFGVSILLITSIASPVASKILLWQPLQYLGKISYSVYLFHLPIMLSLLYLFYEKLPVWSIVSLSLILTILISNLAWILVERPSIKIASQLSNMLTSKKPLKLLKEEKDVVNK